MKPISFPKVNVVFTAPHDVREGENIYSLAAYSSKHSEHEDEQAIDPPFIVACWKLSDEEKEEVMRTGRIWVTNRGKALQPYSLDAFNPFEPTYGANE